MMSVPGSDLLSDALSVLDTHEAEYLKYKGRKINEIGIYVPEYDEPVTLEVSVQSVDRNVYKELGLDFQRNLLTVYVSKDVTDIDRGETGDQFRIFGKLYQIISSNPWFSIDGWSSFTVVEIKPSQETIQYQETMQ